MGNEDRLALELALQESERARRESEALRLLVASLTGKTPQPTSLDEPRQDGAQMH